MAMTEEKYQEKIDALKAKQKELQKKQRAAKKKALAKIKAEEEKKVAAQNAKIADLARLLTGGTDDEIIEWYAKTILQKHPEHKEQVDEILK